MRKVRIRPAMIAIRMECMPGGGLRWGMKNGIGGGGGTELGREGCTGIEPTVSTSQVLCPVQDFLCKPDCLIIFFFCHGGCGPRVAGVGGKGRERDSIP